VAAGWRNIIQDDAVAALGKPEKLFHVEWEIHDFILFSLCGCREDGLQSVF
jgi:hypothetical protein